MKVVALAAALAAGCYSPGYRDCEVTCTEGLCPSGLSCMGGVCRPPGMTGPCGGGGDDASMQLDDATADAPPPTWGPARQVATATTDLRDPTLTSDLLHLYVSNDTGSILYANRTSQAAIFSSPVAVVNLDTNAFEEGPDVSPDHARMYFIRETPSDRDIHETTRDPVANRWATGTHVIDLDTIGETSANPHSVPDSTMIVFENLDLQPTLYIAKRNAPAIAWEPAIGLTQLADANVARSPALSADKLTLYYVRRDGIDTDIFEATRSSVTASFTTAQLVTGDVNTVADENDPWISPDGTTLVFVRRDPNGIFAVFEAKRL